MSKKTIVITAVITFLLTSVFYFSPLGVYFVGINSNSPLSKSFGKFLEAERHIDNGYMGEYSHEALIDGALHGYVDSLNDPYSSYFSKREYEDLNQQLDGEYPGIGIVVSVSEGKILIKEVKQNSPAQKAGLKDGDIILKVNGKDYTADMLWEATDAIKRTKVGDKVTLTLERESKAVEAAITVEKIIEDIVKTHMLGSGVGYVYISSFSTNLAEKFKDAIDELKSQNMKGLILDLRNNPGGTLNSAVAVADMLLPEAVIVTVKDKNGEVEEYKSDAEFLDMPICVIVNEASASSSEVVSAALKDNSAATLVGKKTFGKGVVQSVIGMNDGSGLSITIAKYFTPSGVCINGIGITPDIEADLDAEVVFGEINANDSQLNAARKAIEEQIFLRN